MQLTRKFVFYLVLAALADARAEKNTYQTVAPKIPALTVPQARKADAKPVAPVKTPAPAPRPSGSAARATEPRRLASGVTGKPQTVSGLTISAIDENGTATHSVQIPAQERAPKTLLFKYRVPEELRDYVSYVLEVRDPSRELRYQGAYEGAMPPMVRWDGFFNSNSGLQIRQKYFARLLLVNKDQKVFSSPWFFFTTKSNTAYEGKKIGNNLLKLYVVPTAAFHSISVQTNSFKNSIVPNVYGDLRLIWKEDHTFGVKFEVSANLLFNYSSLVTPDAAFFSDFSFFYRYRLFGTPPHPPNLPLSPPYDPFRPPVPPDAWGSSTNVELGARLFNTTLRGFSGQAVDYELIRQAAGVAGTLNIDQALWIFRLYLTAEFGYSAFKGAIMSQLLEGALTLDRFENFAPGLQFRYLTFSGQPAADQPNAGTTVSNKLTFLGVIFYFKL